MGWGVGGGGWVVESVGGWVVESEAESGSGRGSGGSEASLATAIQVGGCSCVRRRLL